MSPSPSSTTSKTGSDDNSSRMSEAALRKKKNADAQAAFRARRANYIATLEETVTNLEAVVIQLQDSCREAKREANELRAENQRLRQEARRNEKLLKRVLPGKLPDMGSDHDEFMPAPPYSVHPPSATMPSTPMSTAHMTPYSDDAVNYGSDYQASMASTSYSAQEYPQRSPALGFARSVDGDASVDGHPQQMDAHRMARFDQYGYAMDTTCEGSWPQEVLDSGSSSHSPTYVESPILTSPELGYPNRFAVVEDQKVPLSALNTSYAMFPASRSISPASTPTSTSSVSLSSAPFQFTFPEGNVVQERPDFGYRRHTGPELTLHGGTANIPIAATGGEALRYRLAQRSSTAPERALPPAISPYSRAENGSGGRESDSESASYSYSTRSRPRSAASSARVSRSPSPPPICGTLAVIKAQAFGALRRTRTRSKKSSEGAAKAAVEALEARGINMGIAVGPTTKRARLRMDDDNDMQS